MQILCKPGDKFGIGNDVVIEILQIEPELNAVEVRVITKEGSWVELIGPNDDDDSEQEEPSESSERLLPVNRLAQYINN